MAVKKLKKPTRGSQKQKWRPKLKNNIIDKVHEQPVVVKPKQKRTLVIAQELKFARTLASNDKKARVKMLKSLRSWLTVRSKSSFAFTEPEFMRLWKGLYYCMWLSDKPLIQEELAESISQLIFCFESLEVASMYTTCVLKTLSTEWFGIDQYRMDKFQMLVRRIIRQTFVMCKKQLWDEKWTIGIGDVIKTILLDPKGSLGFKFHVTEVYMEELAKVSGGELSEDLMTEFLRPFAIYLATMTDGRQISHVSKFIFRYLIFQSDVGMEYMEKFKAWRQAGFPTGNIDAMQKIELADDEENGEVDEEVSDNESKKNQPLDPRAGSVSVDLPQVPFNPQQISELIRQYKFHPSSTKKNRRQIAKLIDEFDELSRGSMPIGIKEIRIPSAKTPDTNPKVAAQRLIEFQDELYADATRHLNRKKKKKLLAAMNGDSVDDISDAPQAKKPKVDKSNFDDACSENDDHSDEEITPEKKSKAPKDIVLSDKIKKPSIQKESKSKNKKVKTKKLRSMKECMRGELLDGIDDFATFKNTTTVLSKKKKIKYDLNNSWEVSSSESSPVATVVKKPKRPMNIPPVIKISDDTTNTLPAKTPENNIPWLLPVVQKLESERLNPQTPTKTQVTQATGSSSKKRVKIVLQRNTAQATSEYFRQLRLSPAIPFDANKKPRVGVLKPTPLSSPINPFYKKF